MCEPTIGIYRCLNKSCKKYFEKVFKVFRRGALPICGCGTILWLSSKVEERQKGLKLTCRQCGELYDESWEASREVDPRLNGLCEECEAQISKGTLFINDDHENMDDSQCETFIYDQELLESLEKGG